jgi:hydrogenase-4 component F
MLGVILAILIVPLAVAFVSFLAPARVAAVMTIASGVACFGLVLALIPDATRGATTYLSYLRADALSCVFLLATAFLYAAVGVYAASIAQANTLNPR